MGVRISPGDAAWAYGGFNRFRTRLAAHEGLNLDEMEGFGGDKPWETSSGQHVTPLTPLLNHSDCDGYLERYECEEVAPRLRLVLDEWTEDASIENRYDLEHGRRLLAAMEHSIEHGCALVFS